MSRWPHAPSHEIKHAGAHIVTAGTYRKEHLFDSPAKLTLLQDMLMDFSEEFGWKLQAWAVFPNHYHFVGISPDAGSNLDKFIPKLHACSARELNRLDDAAGRKVWHQHWDTLIHTSTSYLARLAYVTHNPVKHGCVPIAEHYEWCSANWLKLNARPAFYETICRFPISEVNVQDFF